MILSLTVTIPTSVALTTSMLQSSHNQKGKVSVEIFILLLEANIERIGLHGQNPAQKSVNFSGQIYLTPQRHKQINFIQAENSGLLK